MRKKKRLCNLGIYCITELDENDEPKAILIRFKRKWVKFVIDKTNE